MGERQDYQREGRAPPAHYGSLETAAHARPSFLKSPEDKREQALASSAQPPLDRFLVLHHTSAPGHSRAPAFLSALPPCRWRRRPFRVFCAHLETDPHKVLQMKHETPFYPGLFFGTGYELMRAPLGLLPEVQQRGNEDFR